MELVTIYEAPEMTQETPTSTYGINARRSQHQGINRSGDGELGANDADGRVGAWKGESCM